MIALRHMKPQNYLQTNFPNFLQNVPQTNTNSMNFDMILDHNSNSNSYNSPNSRNLSTCEARVINDINYFYNSETSRRKLNIILHELKRINNTENFEMFVEYSNIITLKFIFPQGYPFEPPKISYYSGLKFPNLFDESGNLILDTIKKEKWSPVIWLSDLIGSIELILENNLRNSNNNFGSYIIISKKLDYRKRKWTDYLIETQDYYKDKQIFTDLNRSLKRLKGF